MLRSRKMLRLEALETRKLFSINVTGLHHEQIKIDNPEGLPIDNPFTSN